MIARNEHASDCEQIMDMLAVYRNHICTKTVLEDIDRITRMLSYYSFRSTGTADRFCANLLEEYHSDMLSLYGYTGSPQRQSSSSFLRLEQLRSALVRIALMRLSRAGILSLTQTQLTAGEGMLLKYLEAQKGHG